jgi:phospholipid/cholesterol/gamma-HCH transport system ATP-binding protein
VIALQARKKMKGPSVANPAVEPAIVVEGLTARYGEATIFEQVGFRVERGEIFVILGGSGCGKSTLLKHLIGLYQPYAGSVVVNGTDLAVADDRTLNRVRKEFGVLFQSGALFGSMTLAENVALPLQVYTDLDAATIDGLVRTKLALVNLSGFENHLPSEISGGMKKRAGLARAMALDPTILFFDEPSAGLDPVSSAGLDNLIRDLNAALGTTMVIVTHELESIFSIAGRVIMLDKEARGIIAAGDPRELRDSSPDRRVRDFFNRRPPGSADKEGEHGKKDV